VTVRRALRALVLAIAALVVVTGPVSAALPQPEAYLAYRVRVVRHEAHYHYTTLLNSIAEQRSREIVTNFVHTYDLWDRGIPTSCGWGEIIASKTGDDGKDAVRWMIPAWLASPTHAAVLLDPRYEHWGVGMTHSGDRWYGVVIFEDCVR
jgi:hypothetical protein